jgi:hypothetical protein
VLGVGAVETPLYMICVGKAPAVAAGHVGERRAASATSAHRTGTRQARPTYR